jgi:acyl-CoA synthetase (AMP-forming)/AMP-acid ligase II
MGRRLGDLPGVAAARWGNREALLLRGQRFSFRQLALDVDRVAKGLLHLGVAPGEMVAIWLTNCPEWIHAMFACARIGAVHVPINTRFRTADVGGRVAADVIGQDPEGQASRAGSSDPRRLMPPAHVIPAPRPGC